MSFQHLLKFGQSQFSRINGWFIENLATNHANLVESIKCVPKTKKKNNYEIQAYYCSHRNNHCFDF